MQAITENNLGTALQEQQRYDEAIRHHERAIALAPDYAPAYNNLGAALRAAGRVDEAVVQLSEGARAQARLPQRQLQPRQRAARAGPGRRVGRTVPEALAISPQSVEAQNNLGIALAAKGDAPGAIAAFRAALAIDDRSVHAHRNLGNMLIDSRRPRRGRRAPRARDCAGAERAGRDLRHRHGAARGSEFRRRRRRASRRR